MISGASCLRASRMENKPPDPPILTATCKRPNRQVIAQTNHSMIPHDPFHQLRALDRTSPQFRDQLSNFFHGNAYQSLVPDLESEDLAWLVEYLDSVLAGILNHATPAFQESLHELGKLCGTKEVLPKSSILSESLLGCVYEGTFNGSKVRIRRVRIYPGQDPRKVKEVFHQAAAISKHLAHPNIIPLLGVTVDPLELISDWMPGGDLMMYIRNNAKVNRSSLLADVAEGLHYLHSQDVIHGDLKCSNIFVDAAGRARITDFGLAAVMRDHDSMWNASTEHGQSVRWIAPEILGNRVAHSKEADIFSFAGVAIEAFTGAAPFSDKPPHEARLAVTGGERPSRPARPALTNGQWSLIQRCWDHEPHFRPRALRISSCFVEAHG
ncbi:kinase-like domain-containing protein [Thelephora terrestris]|uniref:Kinase-like domain-containing protein n=1 Tax=Thelephora terrestris TaxID=56493 RepID=A0A9P6HKG9_9AGAM|nr:kinase-like domain-containing protein [Thelephora terrestris]